MIAPLSNALVVAAVVVGVWAAVAAVLDRRVSGPQLLAVAALEAVMLVQAVIGLVRLSSSGVEPVTFVGYWLTALVLLPVGALWAIGERSRWGNGVLAVTGCVVAVLVVRLQQIWTAGA